MIDKMITKLYSDNALGKISDDRMERLVKDLEKEAQSLEQKMDEWNIPDPTQEIESNFELFFSLAKKHTHIEVLDRETLETFVDRIEVGDKILPEGYQKMPRKKASYSQTVRIYYKFIGDILDTPERQFTPGQMDEFEQEGAV